MDWKKIEEITGCKIAYASIVGSKRYGVSKEDSDIDYCVFVHPSENNTGYSSEGAYKFPDVGPGDFFFKTVPQQLEKIAIVVGPYLVHTYGGIVYINEDLAEFINENKTKLSNSYPYYTYAATKSSVSKRFKVLQYYNTDYISTPKSFNYVKVMMVMCNFIYNFMNCGDFEKSFTLQGKFLDIYSRARDFDSTLSLSEIEDAISFLYDDITAMFFNEFPAEQELLNNYYNELQRIK